MDIMPARFALVESIWCGSWRQKVRIPSDCPSFHTGKRSTAVDLGYAAADLLNDALVGDTLSVDNGTGDMSDEKSAKGKASHTKLYHEASV